MMNTLEGMLQRLDERSHVLAELDTYYEGRQTLAYLSPEAKAAVGSRFGRLATNVCRLSVNALGERLRVSGFRVDGNPSPALWGRWLAADMDQRATLVHREALTLGRSFVTVWAHPDGSPSVSVESAHQVAIERDPGTRDVLRAVKRWEDATGTNAVLYEPDRITRYRAESKGATILGFKSTEMLDNPLGWVPVVEFANADRILTDGVSEMADLIPLVDALNKLLADMLTASEYYARPRRWATGIELEETDVLDVDGNPTGETVAVNPFPESHRMMINEDPAGKFGSLPSSDLAAYEAAVKVITSQIMAVSSLPAHYVGSLSNQPPSADSLRASEASLTAKAEARQSTFGRSWEQVGRLITAVDTGRDPDAVSCSVSWADPATRSVAQEADAVVKLHTAGLLPASYALARLGYSEDQVTALRAARRAEALDTTGTDLGALLS